MSKVTIVGNVRELASSTSPPTPTEATISSDFISDSEFMDNVETLKALRSFMTQQAVSLKPSEAGKISLGHLNMLRYHPKGRLPYPTEWDELEIRTQELYDHLTEPVRRKFLYGRIPSWVVQAAGYLGLTALGALFVAFTFHPPHVVFLAFLVWVSALGAVGSIAFIGMNALAVQDDATFDITNAKLIILRVALGALFGAVLTLPFGYGSFNEFLRDLWGGSSASKEVSALLSGSVFLLLPFILGFSTSLVIMILNQFVEAVQSFFGKKSNALPAAQNGAPIQRSVHVKRGERRHKPPAPGREQ